MPNLISPEDIQDTSIFGRTLANGEPIGFDDSFAFSCRGCGHLCCVNQEILISPPEAYRIAWAIDRNPLLREHIHSNHIQWAELFVGGSTGLPCLTLNFQESGNGLKPCPFLMPAIDQHNKFVGLAWCAIHAARPSACRIYPLGRMMTMPEGAKSEADPATWTYRIVNRCDGFGYPISGPVPPGYAPPDPKQSVRQFVSAQTDADLDSEKQFYLHDIIPAFMQAGLHAPTDQSPAGLLSEQFVTRTLGLPFYSPPPTPATPDLDHEAVLERLRLLAKLPGEFMNFPSSNK